jgi:hypothetical protein
MRHLAHVLRTLVTVNYSTANPLEAYYTSLEQKGGYMADRNRGDRGDYDYATYTYWWGAPWGLSDFDLYDYNNNWVLDDNEIADIVGDNIMGDPGITWSDSNAIQIDVKDGVVTLSGEVRNPRTKPLAYADAFWSTGVVDVNDNIVVKQRQRKQAQV